MDPDDQRGESALVLTFVEGKPVHIVLSPRKGLCYLITVFRMYQRGCPTIDFDTNFFPSFWI